MAFNLMRSQKPAELQADHHEGLDDKGSRNERGLLLLPATAQALVLRRSRR
jgi:hypothetical protein